MKNSLEQTVSITSEADIVTARRAARGAAIEMGFGLIDVTRIITAASELARNIYRYAGAGVMHCRTVQDAARTGLELEFVDTGPGIPDVEKAMEIGYTSGGGLGLGLPGAKRLMDELEIESTVGKGTRVVIRKWRIDQVHTSSVLVNELPGRDEARSNGSL